MHELVDDPLDRLGDLVALLLVQAGQLALQAQHLGADHVVGHRAQRDHGGRDLVRALAGREGGDLTGHDPADGLDLDRHPAVGVGVGEGLQVDQGDTGQRRGGRVDVAGQGQVEQELRAAPAGGGRERERRLVEHQFGGAGAGDDQVGLGERDRHRLHLDPAGNLTRGGEPGGEALGSGVGAVGDDEFGQVLLRQHGRGQRAHRTGADYQGTLAGQPAELGRGALQADADQ